MNNTSAPQLSQEELLHLALKEPETDKAIILLKQLLDINPTHGQGLYLLGALHAEIGMHDEAITEIKKSIELDENLPDTAHFQLGLLYFLQNDIVAAKEAWGSLPDSEENPLSLFKSAFLLIHENNIEEVPDLIRRGIERNMISPDFNITMQNILDNLSSDQPQESKEDKITAENAQILLSAYNQ